MTIRILRSLLFGPAGLMILGILFMGLGVAFILMGRSDLPERAGLKQVSGLLDEARKIRRQRKGNVSISYELHITSESGQVVKLTLPQEEITEEQAKSIVGRPVTALFSSNDDVWELASGATNIIDYEATRRQHAETYAVAAEVGPYVTGGGFFVSLLGFLFLLRRRRTAES